MSNFQSLSLFLVVVVVATAYILGRFMDHQEVKTGTPELLDHNKVSRQRIELRLPSRQEETKRLLHQEVRDRKLINKAVKQAMYLQDKKNNLQELEVYDISTGRKIKYYKTI